MTKGTIEVGGLTRTYLTYVPLGLTKGAPLVVVMHGSGQNGAQTRKWTGYGFERLADERGFAVVYPDGYEGYWNACNIVGDYSANKFIIDDVGFLTRMVDKLITEIGVDPARVFEIPRLAQARQGPVVARVRSISCGPQQHHRHARNERDPNDRRISRRAGTLAQRL